MKQTEPWWVCNTCRKPVARPKKQAREAMLRHREQCESHAGFQIVQLEQGSIND